MLYSWMRSPASTNLGISDGFMEHRMPNGSASPALEAGTAGQDTAAARAGAVNWTDGQESDFYDTWLRRQCVAIPATRAGVILRLTANGLLTAASFPRNKPPPPDLIRVATRAATAVQPVIAWARRPDGKPGLDLLIALGLRVQDALAAVIAVTIDVPGGVETVDPDALAEQLQMGGGWLDARMSRQLAADAGAKLVRASAAMDIVAVASVQRRPKRAAAAVVNELAIRLRCDRVGLGLVHRNGLKLRALSHVASFQERGTVVDAVENAMEECLAQAAPLAFPALASTQSRISVAHRDLAGIGPEASSAMSVMLPGPDGPAGVLTFERKAGTPFDEQELALAEAAGALLGPVLWMQAANDRVVSGRIVDTVHDGVVSVLGPDKPSRKLMVVVGLLVVGVLSFAKGEYRVSARSVLEGEVQRAAVAPFDGFIVASSVRPGDVLKAGDLLAAFDDRDLILERARAWADAEKSRQKYNEAMAKHDRPNVAMLSAQVDQALAQLALADDKLKRSRIVSPIDGLVVAGDLSQMLGTPVERGKTLFEIAPLDQYRVVLRTDERDLRFVAIGQKGQLALAGRPDDRRSFTISRITAIAEAKDGRNEFRVEATLDEPPGTGLRPGMEGIAKVETGSHHLIWVWSHGLIDWLRLTAWKWLP